MGTNYGVTEDWINLSNENSMVGLIKENLTYVMDTARIRSYPETGTTITDLSGTNVVGTLINGTTYNSDNFGTLVFDGVNDYISLEAGGNTGNPILMATPSTVYAWIYPTTNTGGIFSHWSGGPVNLGYQIAGGKIGLYQYWSEWREYSSTGPSVPLNTWSMVTWVRSSSTSMSLYLNDTLNGTLTPDTANNQFFGGGNMGNFGMLWGWRNFSGRIGIIAVYNGSAHTQSQITQQFNVHKRRYES